MALRAGSLFISSYNNQDYDSSTDFTINLAVPVTKAKRLRFLSATFANLLNPFASNDNLWKFSVNSVEYTMTFPTNIRWNTINDFVGYVNGTLFPGASPSAVTATIAYDTNRNQLYITANNTAHVISMPGWNWNNTQGTSTAYNANYRLGWTSVSTTTSSAGILYADGFPNVFVRTNNIYITTNINADSNNDANVANILGKIPITGGYGALVSYENVHSDFGTPVFSENFKSISIRLLDEDYQPISNPGNAYFNVVIGIEY
jgi:hypothetical protein